MKGLQYLLVSPASLNLIEVNLIWLLDSLGLLLSELKEILRTTREPAVNSILNMLIYRLFVELYPFLRIDEVCWCPLLLP